MSDSSVANERPAEVPILVVGGKEYCIDQLPDSAQRLVQAIRDAEDQAQRLKRQINYIEIARRALIQELLPLLP